MKIDIETFAELVVKQVEATSPGAKVSFDRPDYTLSIKNTEPEINVLVNLRTHYYEYSKEPDMLDDIIMMIALQHSLSNTMPDSFEESKDRLYIHVQDRWAIESQRLLLEYKLPPFDEQPPGKELQFPYVEFGECFALVVAYDTPTMRHIINSTSIDSWNIDFLELAKFAASQLASRSNAPFEQIHLQVSKPKLLSFLKPKKASRTYAATWNDTYDAARVWIPQLFSELEVIGNQIAVIPSAISLIITGSDDLLGLTLALSIYAAEREEDSKSLPPFPLIFENSKPVKYQLPEDHELYNSFKREQDYYWTSIYHQQASILQRTEQCLSGQLHVAEHHNLRTRDEGSNLSATLCTVLEGVINTIPKTDYIQFARIGADSKHEIQSNGRMDKSHGRMR